MTIIKEIYKKQYKPRKVENEGCKDLGFFSDKEDNIKQYLKEHYLLFYEDPKPTVPHKHIFMGVNNGEIFKIDCYRQTPFGHQEVYNRIIQIESLNKPNTPKDLENLLIEKGFKKIVKEED